MARQTADDTGEDGFRVEYVLEADDRRSIPLLQENRVCETGQALLERHKHRIADLRDLLVRLAGRLTGLQLADCEDIAHAALCWIAEKPRDAEYRVDGSYAALRRWACHVLHLFALEARRKKTAGASGGPAEMIEQVCDGAGGGDPLDDAALGEDEPILRKLLANLNAWIIVQPDGTTRGMQATERGVNPETLRGQISRARQRLDVVRNHLPNCDMLCNRCPDCQKMGLTDAEIRSLRAAYERRSRDVDRSNGAMIWKMYC
ncbi:MAG: hypothetical protein KKB50_10675 [Planctomycetes bacterium]|nr:hypothetical protein [Planctomycetota bacterium]